MQQRPIACQFIAFTDGEMEKERKKKKKGRRQQNNVKIITPLPCVTFFA